MPRPADHGSEVLSALLGRVAQGDDQAFAQVYEATSRTVFGIAFRMLRDHAQAQEVTQEVYFQVWQRAATFDPSRGTTSTWINVIAHRKAVDRVRATERTRTREHIQSQLALDVLDSDPESLVLSDLEAHEDARRVKAALAQLPDAQRTAVVLAYFDGYTQQQIADALMVPLGTVKTRTRDALKRLQRLLVRTAS